MPTTGGSRLLPTACHCLAGSNSPWTKPSFLEFGRWPSAGCSRQGWLRRARRRKEAGNGSSVALLFFFFFVCVCRCSLVFVVAAVFFDIFWRQSTMIETQNSLATTYCTLTAQTSKAVVTLNLMSPWAKHRGAAHAKSPVHRNRHACSMRRRTIDHQPPVPEPPNAAPSSG